MKSRYIIATLCIAACMSASAQKGKSRNSAELTNAKELFEKNNTTKLRRHYETLLTKNLATHR